MRVLVIHNPVAGPRDVGPDLDQAVELLCEHGWQVDVRRTLGPGDATTFARQAAAEGYDLVVAAGGDGTLGETASGLAGTDCTMGVLPVGTGNVWAHMLNLPVWTPVYRGALVDAAKVLTQGEARAIDLGMVGGRYFMLWVGVGLDAQIVTQVEPTREVQRKIGFLGILTYVTRGASQVLNLRGTRATLSIDGQVIRQRIVWVVVNNAQMYGPAIRLAPDAQLDDGMLDVYVFKGNDMLDLPRHVLPMLRGKPTQDAKLEVYRARHVRIQSDHPLPYHVDGSSVGHTPIEITVAPKVLKVMFPPWAADSLFEGAGRDRPELTMGERIVMRLRYEQERLAAEGERLKQDVGRRLGVRSDGDDASESSE